MKKTNILAVLFIAVSLAGCKKQPVNSPPQPKAPPAPVPDAAMQVGVSTSGKFGAMLNAPGDYVNGMVSDVAKAKNAAAVYTRKAAETMNADPGTGK